MKQRKKNQQHGVALIMVILLIAITTGILITLTDSTYISMRLNRAAEQRIKAEYLLKSSMHVAQMLIKSDTTQYDDPTQDAWMQFVEGREVPGEMVGVADPNVRVSLLISSEKGKIPILSVTSLSAADPGWRDVLVALFKNLGFDDDPKMANQATQNGGAQKNYSSAEMVANLIDYLDSDRNSYSANDFPAQGIEGELPTGEEFRNDGMLESLSSELASIPGFSPNRIQRLLPFVSIRTRDTININAATAEVLEALVQGLDPSAPPGTGEQLVGCRGVEQGGPYTQNYGSQISACIDPNIASVIKPKLVAQGDVFYVIAKVEYGFTTFMASAHLRSSTGRLPTIENMQLY